MDIIYLLFTAITVFSIIVLFDIIFRQRGNLLLKSHFTIIVLCILISALIVSARINNNNTFVIQIILKAILAASFINIYAVIYVPKLKFPVFLLSLYVVLFTMYSLYMNKDQYMYTRVVTIKTLFDLENNGVNLPIIFQVLHKVMLLVYFSTLSYFAYVIFYVSQHRNAYFKHIKKWSFLLFSISIFTFILYLPFTYLSNSQFNRYIIISFLYLFGLLIIFYRPTFINTYSTSIIFNNNFQNESVTEAVDDFIFRQLFFDNKYYLNTNASLNELAKNMNVSATDLYKYIYLNFPLTFNELVNSNRIKYFVTIITDPKFANYSIDALAKESGFTSRQNLYKPYKKYQGGNPSDLFKSAS